jgi:hypothetical protein
MSTALAPRTYASPSDPAELGWPATFPIELALRVAPTKEVCEAHGITREEWDRLRVDPGFQSCLAGYVKTLREDGMSFRMKARLQAEELLKTSWTLIHAVNTPENVKADLIKHTIKFAGLDASQDQKNSASNQNNFQIVLNLGDGA